MIPYIATYQRACVLSQTCLSRFDIPPACKFRYGTKSANLAVCFLGFSVHKGEEYHQRSAELGVLSSIFDLVSDGMKFNGDAVRRFEMLLYGTLDSKLASLSMEVLNRKKAGSFKFDGLERGIPTLQIIIQHLHAEKSRPCKDEIFQLGILCQIVDDIIDYRADISNGALNFLRHESWRTHIKKLMEWDYEEQFSENPHPFVLLNVFKRAKAKAAELAELNLTVRQPKVATH